MRPLATRRTAAAVIVCEGALAIPAVILNLAVHAGELGVIALLILAFLAVGSVVAYRRPAHRMGWMLLGVSGLLLLNSVTAGYSELDYRNHHGALPLGQLAVLIGPSWAPVMVLFILCVLLYPDGRLPSRRWRWPVFGLLTIAALWQFGLYSLSLDAIVTRHIAFDASGNLSQTDAPPSAWVWWEFVSVVYFAAIAGLLIAWVTSQVVGYRSLSSEQRLQQKWLLSGAAIAVGAAVLWLPAAIVSSNRYVQAVGNVAPVGLVAVPVAIGVGILRFRLYDIDRLISRTLAYLLLTALLVGAFIASVELTTQLLPFSSTVGVAASTLAAAALFNPLRVRVQRAVDRRFNRTRYDADKTVDAFAAQLRDAVDLDTVQAELLAAVNSAVQPKHATIWIRDVTPG